MNVDEIIKAVSELSYSDVKIFENELKKVKTDWVPREFTHVLSHTGEFIPEYTTDTEIVKEAVNFGMVCDAEIDLDARPVMREDYRRYHLCYLAWREIVGWEIDLMDNTCGWAIEEVGKGAFACPQGGSPLLGFWFDTEEQALIWWDMIGYLFEEKD